MLSVIVPVYNIDKYLKQCVDSIINQTYKDLEIILVDDGSNDSSGVICDAYANIDSRVAVIHKLNGGLVSARKAGLRIAKGEYVTYVDGDDWIDNKAYENMMYSITSYDADMIMCGHFENTGEHQSIVHHNVKSGIYDKTNLTTNLYPQMIAGENFFEWKIFPAVWDMVIKKELLEKSQFEVDDDISMGEDAACKYPCLLMANKVLISNETYYHYRQTSDSMIKQRLDIEVEHRKFSKLYHNVNDRFAQLSNIYDLRKQWLSYIMFLMLPRADHLYKTYNQMDYLFPYANVKRGMKIALYGAGTYGQRLYSYISENGFCDVVAWFDRNYEQLTKMGFDVKDPKTISEYEFEGIIVANMFSNSRKHIVEYIKQRKNCAIYQIEETDIFSEEYLKGFGLI